ncbi:hypothetical protein LguiB_006201 [Lonicera macranthoides]
MGPFSELFERSKCSSWVRLPVDDGMGIVRELDERIKYLSWVRLPIDDGMGHVRELDKRAKDLSCVRLSIDDGMGPVRELDERAKDLSWVELSIDDEMGPDRELKESSKDLSWDRLSTDDEMGPVRELNERSKNLTWVRLLIDDGMGPVRELNERSKNLSWVRLSIDDGMGPISELNERNKLLSWVRLLTDDEMGPARELNRRSKNSSCVREENLHLRCLVLRRCCRRLLPLSPSLSSSPPSPFSVDVASFSIAIFSIGLHFHEKLFVLLRDGRKLLGILRSFDQFANAVLEGACERVIIGDLYCDLLLGLYVIRGENVVLIGELDLEKEELPPHMTRVSPAEIKREDDRGMTKKKPMTASERKKSEEACINCSQGKGERQKKKAPYTTTITIIEFI